MGGGGGDRGVIHVSHVTHHQMGHFNIYGALKVIINLNFSNVDTHMSHDLGAVIIFRFLELGLGLGLGMDLG